MAIIPMIVGWLLLYFIGLPFWEELRHLRNGEESNLPRDAKWIGMRWSYWSIIIIYAGFCIWGIFMMLTN